MLESISELRMESSWWRACESAKMNDIHAFVEQGHSCHCYRTHYSCSDGVLLVLAKSKWTKREIENILGLDLDVFNTNSHDFHLGGRNCLYTAFPDNIPSLIFAGATIYHSNNFGGVIRVFASKAEHFGNLEI